MNNIPKLQLQQDLNIVKNDVKNFQKNLRKQKKKKEI